MQFRPMVALGTNARTSPGQRSHAGAPQCGYRGVKTPIGLISHGKDHDVDATSIPFE